MDRTQANLHQLQLHVGIYAYPMTVLDHRGTVHDRS